MRALLFLAAFVSGCVAFDPEIIRRSSIRKAAGSKLWSCIKHIPSDPKSCLPENQAYCLSQGLEKNCGVDDAWDASLSQRSVFR